MSAVRVVTWKSPGPTNGGFSVPEGSDIPRMRPRSGQRGSDRALTRLLCEALEDFGGTPCGFWAREGPSRPRHMATCRKCYAMRRVATVVASLRAREA
jgi:hypothetical protein